MKDANDIIREKTAYKQQIIVLSSLKMPKGKIVAQACHASLGSILKHSFRNENGDFVIPSTPAIESWLSGEFTKVALRVDTLEELEQLYEEAVKRNLLCAKIIDNGHTVFNGVKTVTCIGIGPAHENDLDFTKHLKLL